MDYQATLFDPIYTVQGVPGLFTNNTTTEMFTVLDKTSGIDIGEIDGNVEVQTIRPAAVVRMKELRDKAVSLAALEGAVIVINSFEWRIDSYRLRPSPKGQNDGEVYLILSDGAEVSESVSESE